MCSAASQPNGKVIFPRWLGHAHKKKPDDRPSGTIRVREDTRDARDRRGNFTSDLMRGSDGGSKIFLGLVPATILIACSASGWEAQAAMVTGVEAGFSQTANHYCTHGDPMRSLALF